jgi:NTE family protein
MTNTGDKIGLALSGGGYRAAAFHLGTLTKLNEMGILPNVDVISTISGGSIAGAYYLLNMASFADFARRFRLALQKSTVSRIVLSPRFMAISFSYIGIGCTLGYLVSRGSISVAWMLLIFFLISILIITFLHNIVSLTSIKAKVYEKLFFGKSKLIDLPNSPSAAINATNLDTGTLWTFSKDRMGDSSYEYRRDGQEKIEFKVDDFPLARAVATSTAVPFPFDPVRIGKKYFVKKADAKRVSPRLLDGGIYDNQGIQKLTQSESGYRCDIVICSDGSAPFGRSFRGINPLPILNRVVQLMKRRVKTLQFVRDVYHKREYGIKQIAYFSLDWEYERCLTGFYDALQRNRVDNQILDAHEITKNFGNDVSQIAEGELLKYIKERINYYDITLTGLSSQEILRLKRIGTNLTALSSEEVDSLTKHASTLTEIQIRLYCPSLA